MPMMKLCGWPGRRRCHRLAVSAMVALFVVHNAWAQVPGEGGRHFYLTAGNHVPASVLLACSADYHMATLWEILDVSGLKYHASHPDAYSRADSGQGPPAGWNGWIRTGYQSSASTIPGRGNCNAWSSVDPSAYGTIVHLSTNWQQAAELSGPWVASTATCNLAGPVWCVGDFYEVSVASTGASGVPVSSTTGHDGFTDYMIVVPNGAAVELTAPVSASGLHFVSWIGCPDVQGATCTLSSVHMNHDLVLRYAPDEIFKDRYEDN